VPLVVVAGAVLGGCATGTRPSLRPDSIAVGIASVDAVLTRLWSLPDAVYSASYDSVVVFGDAATEVSTTQDRPDRRSLTIGDVRYIADGDRVETCDLAEETCHPGHDAAAVSDTLLTPDFFWSTVSSRLRRDAALAIAAPTPSTEDVDGRTATCVTIALQSPASAPESEPSSTYCVLDNGVLTRLDASDLTVTITSYDDEFDAAQLES